MRSALVLIGVLCAGCASVPGTKYAAEMGQATDSLSTVIAINSGMFEANPVIANHLWSLKSSFLACTRPAKMGNESS